MADRGRGCTASPVLFSDASEKNGEEHNEYPTPEIIIFGSGHSNDGGNRRGRAHVRFHVDLGSSGTITWTATAVAETDVNPFNNSVTSTTNVKNTSGGGGH